MFSQRIINSGKFLKMPQTSQALYFHLGINADDDGVVEAYKIIRMGGFGEDDLKVLVSKDFVKVLNEDLVSYILDWREHNLIRSDRKIDSIYKDLLLQIVPDAEVVKPMPRADTKKITGRPLDNQWTAQVRIGQDRLGKVNKEEANFSFNKNISRKEKASPGMLKVLLDTRRKLEKKRIITPRAKIGKGG